MTTKADRSAVMRAVKARNTRPETRVRSVLHRLGYRFRLHRADLPGTPDIVLPARRTAIFVHGCFWHGHDCPRGAREPKTNRDYWSAKIARNRARDADVLLSLAALDWRVVIVWECATKNEADLAERLRRDVPPPLTRPSSARR
jgi:DNA mismatch endonuclease (patch repair protein)